MKPLKKRGQISIFMVIGFLLLIGSGIILYISLKPEILPAQQQFDISEQQALVTFVQSCLEKTARPVADKLITNAGTLEPGKGRWYDGHFYPYLCVQDPKAGCRPLMITRSTMEKELNRCIAQTLDACLDFKSFEKEGFTVTADEHTVKTVIHSENIEVRLQKRIKMAKAGKQFSQDAYRVTVRSDVGKIYDVATQILYDEVDNAFFDEDQFMIDHGENIEIRKHKPYPDVVYKITHIDPETLNLQEMYFAIQGRDISSFRGNTVPLQQKSKGYCNIKQDNNCYANVDAQICGLHGGEWQSKPFPVSACTSRSILPGSACPGGVCEDCADHKHGESWCVYDGIVGSGFDAVGSRHYKQSCMNGKIYTTECADFRDELCTEVGTKAVCRNNRWEDCVAQEDQESCEDTAVRDCYWNDWLDKAAYFRGPSNSFENRRCIPIVPPGSKHWLGEGQALCQVANEQYNCDGIKCPKVWVDSAAVYCYQMGDCGDYFQKDGDFGVGGYENTAYDERVYVYNIPFDTDFHTQLSLPLFSFKQQPLTGLEYDFDQSTLSTINRNLALWKKRSKNQQIVPDIFTMVGNIFSGEDPTKADADTLHTAYCGVWTESRTDEVCSSCQAHPWKPCTEYKCKSIASNCQYVEKNGYGACVTGSKKSSLISATAFLLDKEKIGELDTLTRKDLLKASKTPLTVTEDLRGYTVVEEVDPYSIVTLVVEDTKPVNCRSNAVGGGFNPLEQPVSEGNAQLLHFFAVPLQQDTVSAPLITQMPELNFSFDAFDTNNSLIQKKLHELGNLNNNYNGLDLETVKAMLSHPSALADYEKFKDLQKAQIQQTFYDKGNVIQYQVTCGTHNPFHFQFKVRKAQHDFTLLGTEPTQGKKVSKKENVLLSFDQPVSCTYQQDSETRSFECDDPFSAASGKFDCLAAVTFTDQKTLRVTCRLPAVEQQHYQFSLKKGKSEETTFLLPEGRLSLPASRLGSLFALTVPEVPLSAEIGFDGLVRCRVSDKKDFYDRMNKNIPCTAGPNVTCSLTLPAGETFMSCEDIAPPVAEKSFLLQWT